MKGGLINTNDMIIIIASLALVMWPFEYSSAVLEQFNFLYAEGSLGLMKLNP